MRIVLLISLLLVSLWSKEEGEQESGITLQQSVREDSQAAKQKAEELKKKSKKSKGVRWSPEALEIVQRYQKDDLSAEQSATVQKYVPGKKTDGIEIVPDREAAQLLERAHDDNSDFALSDLFKTGKTVPVTKPSWLKSLYDRYIKRDYNYRLGILKDIAAIGKLPKDAPKKGESPYISSGMALIRLHGYERDLLSKDLRIVQAAKKGINALFDRSNLEIKNSKEAVVNRAYCDLFGKLGQGVLRAALYNSFRSLTQFDFSTDARGKITMQGYSNSRAVMGESVEFEGDQAMLLKSIFKNVQGNFSISDSQLVKFLNGDISLRELQDSVEYV